MRACAVAAGAGADVGRRKKRRQRGIDGACSTSAPSTSDDLIERVAKLTGKQFIVDPRVRAEVSLTGLDVGRVDYERLLAILAVHQFATYQSAGFVVIVPDASARQFPVPVANEIAAATSDNEIVTLVVQVKTACAAYLVPIVRPLMPQHAHLAALPPNTLIVVDRAGNARRVVDMIERIDKAATPGAKCGPEILGSKSASKPEAN